MNELLSVVAYRPSASAVRWGDVAGYDETGSGRRLFVIKEGSSRRLFLDGCKAPIELPFSLVDKMVRWLSNGTLIAYTPFESIVSVDEPAYVFTDDGSIVCPILIGKRVAGVCGYNGKPLVWYDERWLSPAFDDRSRHLHNEKAVLLELNGSVLWGLHSAMQEHEVLSCDFISQTMDGTTLYKISDIGGDNLLVSSSEITEVSPQIIKRRLPMTMYDYVVQRHSAGRMLVARAYDDDEIHIVVDGRASKVAAPLTLSSVLGGLALVYADHVIVVRPVDGF